MRTLGFSLFVLALAGCAALEPRVKPLSGADVVALAREGRSPQQIIDELRRTDTVLPLQASDIVALHESGVPKEVLDYLQRVQIEDIRWRDRNSAFFWHGPLNRGFGPCPWPSSGLRPYRGGPWGC